MTARTALSPSPREYAQAFVAVASRMIGRALDRRALDRSTRVQMTLVLGGGAWLELDGEVEDVGRPDAELSEAGSRLVRASVGQLDVRSRGRLAQRMWPSGEALPGQVPAHFKVTLVALGAAWELKVGAHDVRGCAAVVAEAAGVSESAVPQAA